MQLTYGCKNVMLLVRNVRNLIHRDNYGRQEFVSDPLHVLDGGLQSCPHLLVGHGLLRSHVVRQLTVQERQKEMDDYNLWSLFICLLAAMPSSLRRTLLQTSKICSYHFNKCPH